MGLRRTVAPEVSDSMALDFLWMNAECIPVSRNIRIVDVPANDLVRAKRRPPYNLSSTCESKSDRLGNGWRARRSSTSHRGDKV